MNIARIGINNTPIINQDAKYAKIKNNGSESQKDGKEVLNNPMEIVGRSQVNFKALSAKELNLIAKSADKFKLTKEEIRIAKEALEATKKECKFVDLEAMKQQCSNNMELGLDTFMVFMNKVVKIKPGADIDKLGMFFNAAF